ncbi:outer membrane protein assembly factor BamB [Candidatus Erwinia haradaeae]|uniref:Outer membrane protein assembly factor BamB n=1 Tax=Candidatus Erwinia haradaeae TaxID=1922217 RepID=A0A803GCD1_9GAMM|nr:outer membrane protein assembly factor BamB [Candidatus Erwinia haradaeae]VFP87378.1 Outer membrane protein assembly factor BamB [Candidatus Erwinia haradaeae]
MILHKLLITDLILIALVSGCSWSSKTDEIRNASPLLTIENQFKTIKLWSSSIKEEAGNINSKLHPTSLNKTIYAANRYGIIKALYSTNGKEKWITNLSENKNLFSKNIPALLSGGLTVSNNHIYVGTERAKIFSINTMDGSVDWTQNVAGEVLSAPVISDYIVLVHTSNGMLQGLDQNNGSIKWSINLDTPTLSLRGQSEPTITLGTVVIGSDNGYISAININDGQIIWQKKITRTHGASAIDRLTDVDVSPLIVNGIIYSLAYNGNLTALTLESGQILWQHDIGSAHDLISDDHRIFLVDKNDCLIALTAEKGLKIWKQSNLLYRKLTSPILYNGYLVVGDQQGYLYWINTNTGQIVSQQKIDNTGFVTKPVISNDNLLVLQSTTGKISVITN